MEFVTAIAPSTNRHWIVSPLRSGFSGGPESIACWRSLEHATGIPDEIAALAEARVQARLAKDWRKSDELRDELSARGWEARDTKDGQKVTRRAGA